MLLDDACSLLEQYQMVTNTGNSTDRQTDGWTDWLIDRLTDWLPDWLTEAIHQANNPSRMLAPSQRNSLKSATFEIGWRLATTLPNAPERNLHIEVKFDYQLEDYLRTIRNPAHRISMTKLRLGVHSLRIQTGKYENRDATIPVEGRKCLVCNRGHIEDERRFLMYCPGYDK